MTLLAQFYASAPTKYVQVNTLDIHSAAFTPIRICDQYEDIEAATDLVGRQQLLVIEVSCSSSVLKRPSQLLPRLASSNGAQMGAFCYNETILAAYVQSR